MKVSIISIMENMPKDLTDIEKVRYLYLEIGKVISYNVEYIYSIDTRYAKDIYDEKITIDSIEKNNYQNKIMLLCKQASEILNEALNEINIKSRCIGFEEGSQYHVDVLVNIHNKRYCLNLIKDVANIQKGLRTTGFATTRKLYDGTNCDTIKQDDLKIIDKKLGYCRNNMYMDDAISMLKEEIKDVENIKKYIIQENPNLNNKKISKDTILKYKIQFIYKFIKNNLCEKDKMEIVEIKAFYKKLFKEFLSKTERDIIRFYDFYYKSDNQIKHSTISEIQFKDEKIHYIYDDKQRKFTEITKENLKELSKSVKFFSKEPEQER
ncbi:MAG: hypothetical protein IJE05_05220 [Clostridia bacterium]|nr:hypothetical protein [Clostridia bacterium]